MEALFATVLVVALIYLLIMPKKAPSEIDWLDEYEKRFIRGVKQFEEQHVMPRQTHLIELDREIERYQTELHELQDMNSNPNETADIFSKDIEALSNDDWLQDFKEAEKQRGLNIMQARIYAYENSDGAQLLNRKAELLAQVETLQAAKSQLINETKTYISMMEKLNESK